MQTPHHNPSDDPPRDPTIPIILSVLIAGAVSALSLYFIGNVLLPRVFGTEVATCNIDNPCLDGMQCRKGKCVPRPRGEKICGPDDAPGTCHCPETREWVGDRCIRKQSPAPSCDTEAFTLIAKLREAQQRCKKQVQGDITSCRPADIRQFMLEQDQFYKILNKFPSTTWVLFPPARPKLDGTWPSKPVLQHYVSNLRFDEPLLNEAANILFLSHVTNDQNPRNDAFLQERLKFGFRLVQELASQDPERWSKMREKFLPFPIPSDQPVTPDDIRSAGEVNLIAWDQDSQFRYGKMLETLRKGGDLGKNEWDELTAVFNRSVTIVPVLCELPPTPNP